MSEIPQILEWGKWIVMAVGIGLAILSAITLTYRRDGQAFGPPLIAGIAGLLITAFGPFMLETVLDPALPQEKPIPEPPPPGGATPIEFSISTGAGIAIASGTAMALILLMMWPRVAAARAVSKAASAERREQAAREAMQRRDAVASIHRVQADYGQLLIDVSYVIEHHALFDLSFAPTRRFNELLWQAQEAPLEALDVDQIRDLSAQLSLAFQEAKQDAERRGFSALGSSGGKGRRAAKLARKAASTDSEHERRALMNTVRSILDTIGVVLPAETAEALEHVTRKELPESPGNTAFCSRTRTDPI